MPDTNDDGGTYVLGMWRAQPVGKDIPPKTIIRIVDVFPQLSMEDSDQAHEDGAEKLASALWESLPGGTFNRLLAKLLVLKAGSLTVTLER